VSVQPVATKDKKDGHQEPRESQTFDEEQLVILDDKPDRVAAPQDASVADGRRLLYVRVMNGETLMFATCTPLSALPFVRKVGNVLLPDMTIEISSPPPPTDMRPESIAIPRGKRRLAMSCDFLAQVIVCQRVSPGRRIYSNIPHDLEVQSVHQAGQIFEIMANSAEWSPAPSGEQIPLIPVVFHEEAAP
jgi:hypothetical protein